MRPPSTPSDGLGLSSRHSRRSTEAATGRPAAGSDHPTMGADTYLAVRDRRIVACPECGMRQLVDTAAAVLRSHRRRPWETRTEPRAGVVVPPHQVRRAAPDRRRSVRHGIDPVPWMPRRVPDPPSHLRRVRPDHAGLRDLQPLRRLLPPRLAATWPARDVGAPGAAQARTERRGPRRVPGLRPEHAEGAGSRRARPLRVVRAMPYRCASKGCGSPIRPSDQAT